MLDGDSAVFAIMASGDFLRFLSSFIPALPFLFLTSVSVSVMVKMKIVTIYTVPEHSVLAESLGVILAIPSEHQGHWKVLSSETPEKQGISVIRGMTQIKRRKTEVDLFLTRPLSSSCSEVSHFDIIHIHTHVRMFLALSSK